jgi:hypothetical protein
MMREHRRTMPSSDRCKHGLDARGISNIRRFSDRPKSLPAAVNSRGACQVN